MDSASASHGQYIPGGLPLAFSWNLPTPPSTNPDPGSEVQCEYWSGIPLDLTSQDVFRQQASTTAFTTLVGRFTGEDRLSPAIEPKQFETWNGLPIVLREISQSINSCNTMTVAVPSVKNLDLAQLSAHKQEFATWEGLGDMDIDPVNINGVWGGNPFLDTLPTIQSLETLRFQRDIREHFAHLANPADAQMFGPDGIEYPVATYRQLRRFRKTWSAQHGPSKENFVYDTTGQKTQWNKALADVFVESFCSSQQAKQYPYADRTFVRKAFMTRLRSIRVEGLEEPTTIKARLQSAQTWRLMDHRLGTLYVVLQSCPDACHSDDESDHSKGRRMYRIRDLSWQNPALGLVFRALDSLHVASRYGDNGRINRGNWPRPCYVSDLEPLPTPPPQGLPINFYNQDYLDGLSDDAMDELNVSDPVHIQLSADLLRFSARFEGPLKDKNMPPLPCDDPSLPTYQTSLEQIRRWIHSSSNTIRGLLVMILARMRGPHLRARKKWTRKKWTKGVVEKKRDDGMMRKETTKTPEEDTETREDGGWEG
ncbi:hypothetical protein BJ165DRAFT_1534588 [Panaeolus papilionaceus]|nr:hypothetical protein BJ165DRAFT_1534588 [Panaeolus papilionaceus]